MIALAKPVILGNGAPLSRTGTDGFVLNVLISLTLQSTTGYTSFAWTLLQKPDGSASTLTASSGFTSSFTPDLPGTYKIKGVASGANGAYSALVAAVAMRTELGLLLVDDIEDLSGDEYNEVVRTVGTNTPPDASVTAAKIADGSINDNHVDPTPPAAFGELATYLRTIKTFTPTGTSADAPKLREHLAAMAGVGEVRIKPGTAIMSAAAGSPAVDINDCSRTLLIGHPNARLVSTLAAGGGGVFNNFMFRAFSVYGGSGTFASTPTLGSKTISSDTSIAVGSVIVCRSTNGARAFLASTYKVKGISGTGPYTLTLDRPMRFPFLSGDNIQIVTQRLEDFILEGCGMHIDGPGDRLLEFIGAHRVGVRNINFGPDDSGGYPSDLSSFDIGCVQCGYTECSGDVPGASNGLLHESGDRGYTIRSYVDSVGHSHVLWDSVDMSVVDSGGASVSAGLLIDSNTMSIGCRDVRVSGGSFSKGTNDGILVSYSNDTLIDGVRCDDNASVGILVTSSSARTTLHKCKTRGNAAYDVQVASSSSGTRLIAYENQGGAVGLQIDGSDVTIDGYTCTGSVSGQAMRVDGGAVVARGLRLTPTTTSNTIYQTGGTLEVSGTVAGAASAVHCAGGTMRVRNLTTSGAGVGVYNSAGSVMFEGANDLASSTPVRNDNGQAGVSHDVSISLAHVAGAPGAGTSYIGRGGTSATEANVTAVAARKIYVRDLPTIVGNAPSSGKTGTWTLRVGSGPAGAMADTAVVVTIAGTATAGSKDASPNASAVVINPGDRYCVKQVLDAGNLAADIRVTIAGIGA